MIISQHNIKFISKRFDTLFIFAIIFCLIFNVSCKENKSITPLRYYNDFDQNFGWDAYSQHLKTAPAHSGRIVTYADTINPFSGGFNLKMADLKFSYPVQKVTVSAWFYSDDLNTSAVFVFELLDPNKKGIIYYKKELKGLITSASKWHKVDFEIPLDKMEYYNVQNEIKIYTWLPAKGPEVLIDDMEIIFQ
jgi:hypothetical protein